MEAPETMAKEKEEGDVLFKKLVGGKFGGKARYHLVMDSPQAGVEQNYFKVLRGLTDLQPFGRGITGDQGYIVKTKDIYDAGETSSYWGNVEQRKGIQIDKFQQIMQNVGGMIKAMFQLLRELRILEERLEFYEKANKGDSPSEVHLKSVWIDTVEGGIQNATSVLGLTTKVGFAALADLFFTIHPKTSDDVARRVEDLKRSHGINKKVREVLGRKLKQYLIWRQKTYDELSTGRRFKLGYLRQHYSVIKLYLDWLRPYLRNIKKLQMDMKGKATDADLVTAFETSKIELEFLAIRTKYGRQTERGTVETEFKDYFPVIRVQINFVAIPHLAYQEEGNRGAVHRGRAEIIIEGAVLTKKDLDTYKKRLDEEDMELLSYVDESINALKDELQHYLDRAEEEGVLKPRQKEEKKDKKNDIRTGVLEPFIALGDFFKELAGVGDGGKKGKKHEPVRGEEGAAKGSAKTDAYLGYYIFKKQSGLFTE